jgi:DegV family protein with EDD domain
VPLSVNWGGERSEPETATPATFYADLRSSERLPTTSQPSLGDFVAAYEPLLSEGRSVVSVHLSGGLSGTCDAARQAARLLADEGGGGERVRVVDSRTTAGALGLLALVAARHAAAGDDADAVAAAVEVAREPTRLWACLDTLEYLRRGGRIGGARAWIGSTLRIKPIVAVDGEIVPVERVRTQARALERLVELAQEHTAGPGGVAWTVQHADAPTEAEALAGRCREALGGEPEWISEIGPVLGTHGGPGLLALAVVPGFLLA